ncbi:MAG TPA: LamG domain-containing protein, partial [Kofleriaceae bacterium]|nr:LamG domain-containing protein [Kofleriaceae bacterium]
SVTATGLTFVAGKTGMAGRFVDSTSMTAAENAALATMSFTIEAWVRLGALPAAGGRMAILDNDGEYGLFVHDSTVQCNGLTATVTLATNTWTHLACTIDAATTTGRLYIDGTERATASVTVGIAAAPGLAIGANSGGGVVSDLIGDLDQLRLFGAARTAAQVCAAAGKTACP